MMKLFVILGAANAGLAVALGAFGAHGLKSRIAPERLDVYQTAVQYHFYHSLGLVMIGLAAAVMTHGSWLRGAGWTMTLGIALFCGSLYALSLGAPRALGIVTPFGGIAFIASWGLLVAAAWQAS